MKKETEITLNDFLELHHGKPEVVVINVTHDGTYDEVWDLWEENKEDVNKIIDYADNQGILLFSLTHKTVLCGYGYLRPKFANAIVAGVFIYDKCWIVAIDVAEDELNK